MTSQGGQRFRRRALRRGYKVDEVDSFLDRVEVTLNGELVGAPATAQEAHDVVFRVRFGGYDEWQVDLHLDRVERQLAELEEQGVNGQLLEERHVPLQLPAAPLPPPMRALAPAPGFEEKSPFEQPAVVEEHAYPPAPVVRDDYPTQGFPNVVVTSATPVPTALEIIPMDPPAAIIPQSRLGSGEFPGTDETSFNSGGYDPAGRHGRMDMTTEMSAVTGAYTPDEIAKVDALRRTFQPRRFGSGYDPAQVDRLFDAVMAFMTGRSSSSVADGELDHSQFTLVHGGYFEVDVEAALREVRELFSK